MDQLIVAELLMSLVAAKLKAFKATLTADQLQIYNQSLADSKEKILKRYPSLSPELQKLVEEQLA